MKNYKILFHGNVVSSCLVIFLGNTLLVSDLFWTSGKVPWIRVCWSFCPEVFLRSVPFFLKFSMMFGTHVAESAFLKKLFLFQKWEKWAKNEPEMGFLNLLEYLVIYFFWIWFITKVYIICCILAQIYIARANWWKKLIFLHGDTASWKLKVDWKILGHGQKCVWPLWSQDSKIACISRSN